MSPEEMVTKFPELIAFNRRADTSEAESKAGLIMN
jgi:hypothetical protein